MERKAEWEEKTGLPLVSKCSSPQVKALGRYEVLQRLGTSHQQSNSSHHSPPGSSHMEQKRWTTIISMSLFFLRLTFPRLPPFLSFPFFPVHLSIYLVHHTSLSFFLTHLFIMLIFIHVEVAEIEELVIPGLGQSFETVQDTQVEGTDTRRSIMEGWEWWISSTERTKSFFWCAI